MVIIISIINRAAELENSSLVRPVQNSFERLKVRRIKTFKEKNSGAEK